MSEKGGEVPVEPRSSVRPFIDEQTEKIESLEAQKKRMQKRWGIAKSIGAGILMGLAAKGGLSTFNESVNAINANQDNRPTATDAVKDNSEPESTPAPVPEPTPESERATYQKEIEEKYGIELFNQREGYERTNKVYDESNEDTVGHRPVVRWGIDQLNNADEIISYIPPHFFAPDDNGRKFAISLWDYGAAQEYGGMYHGGANMISANENAFTNDRNKEEQLSFLAHELGHRMDSQELKENLSLIIDKDRSFLEGFLFAEDNKWSTANPDIPQVVATFEDLGFGKGTEGRANFFQTYVKGYERFMKAAGPVIDSGEFDPNIPREELANRYPKAQKIYDLYKEIFEGREYDEIQKKLDPDFKYLDVISEGDVIIKPAKITNYEIKNYTEYSDAYIMWDWVTIQEILDVFPEYMFENLEGSDKFKIILDEEQGRLRHNGEVVVISRKSLRKEKNPYEYQLDAVGTIGHELAHRANELKGFEPQEKLIELLGGEEFLQNPEKLFPKLFEKDDNGEYKNDFMFTEDGTLISSEEMIALFSERYLGGDERFRHIRYLFDPEDLYTRYSGKKLMREEKNALGFQIYRLIRDEIFSGREYESSYGFVPEYTDRSSN